MFVYNRLTVAAAIMDLPRMFAVLTSHQWWCCECWATDESPPCHYLTLLSLSLSLSPSPSLSLNDETQMGPEQSCTLRIKRYI